jgi:hypothetical protein
MAAKVYINVQMCKGDVQMCRCENMQMNESNGLFYFKIKYKVKKCRCVNRYVSNNLHICIFAHLLIRTLLTVPVNDIQYHFVFL